MCIFIRYTLYEEVLYCRQVHFLNIYNLRQGWLAADNWMRGAGTSVMQDRGNSGKGKLVRARRRCANTRTK